MVASLALDVQLSLTPLPINKMFRAKKEFLFWWGAGESAYEKNAFFGCKEFLKNFT